MPIVIPKDLPAYKILKDENIFVMKTARATKQDIRPLEIAIVNLMPTKIETETQLVRLLSNSPLQVNITLIKTSSYKSKHISESHMERFYNSIDDIKSKYFDGMIVTGAPVEKLDYEKVLYWDELKQIMDYAKTNVTSTIYICWSAQAALKYYHDIDKVDLSDKLFGVFPYKAKMKNEPLLKGMDDHFYIPMSRYTDINLDQLKNEKSLRVIAESDKGVAIIKSKDNRTFYFLGHSEYDRDTLQKEYLRDLEKGLKINMPVNYFVGGDINKIDCKWRSTANLIYYNWLNYYVYQETPYRIEKIDRN